MALSVDASNSCIPPTHNLTAHTPPLPKTTRGEPIILDGTGGRLNSDRPVLVYPSGRLVIVRELQVDLDTQGNTSSHVKAFVYRGHTAQVTCAKFSPSGCYIASGDIRGKIRVWSYDNEEHLCKLELNALSGPIRDIDWDMDSKRIVVVGDGSKTDSQSPCTKVFQWDSGVKMGDLAQHAKKRSSSCAFKPNRPMRIVTGGGEDSQCLFNKGPPFARVTDGLPAENAHSRGSVHCVRYNSSGGMIASVGTDKSVCFYDGKTMELLERMENVHSGSIYSCAWNFKGDELITCSADGTVKLIHTDGGEFKVVHTWDVAATMTSDKPASTGSGTQMGSMLMGCAFVQGDIPVAISLNGQVAILPSTSSNNYSGDIQVLRGHQSPISSHAIDYSKKVMYTGDSDGVICVWDLESGTAITNVQRDGEGDDAFDSTYMNKCHRGTITGMTFTEGNLLSIGWDDKMRLSNDNTMAGCVNLDSQPTRISKGTSLVVIATVNGLLLVRDNAVVSDLIQTSYEPLSVCVSSDDGTVYVGGNDCNIHIYNVDGDSLNEVETLDNCHQKPVHAVSLSNDGTKLASADDRDICVFNVTEGYSKIIQRGRWCFHLQKINVLSWSNDDSVLASGGNDDSIYLWSLKKLMTRVHYSFCHRGGVTGLEFLKGTEDMVLVSVGNDGCVNKWDVTDAVVKKFGK